MSRRARLMRKYRRLMRWIEREEAILGRPKRLSRQLAVHRLRAIRDNLRVHRWWQRWHP